MKINVLVPLLLSLILVAGCLGGTTETKTNQTQQVPTEEVKKPVEEIIKEKPKVSLVDYPKEINLNENGFFKWSITGVKGKISRTAVYLGKVSTPQVSESSTPQDTSYTISSTDYSSGSFTVPGEFSSYVKISEPGTYYARAYAYIDGKNVWSDEVVFTVKGEKGQPVKEFTVKVSDAGFDPQEIEVDKGDLVILKFEVSADETNQNGVRIVSPKWEALPLKPGSSYEVRFTADQSFEYRLFWMAGNLLRATGKVTVK